MQQGLGGYGRVDARMPMPVGGGAPAGSPVGALLQMLMQWKGSAPQNNPIPAGADADVARMLGLAMPPAGQQMAQDDYRPQRPLESWLGRR